MKTIFAVIGLALLFCAWASPPVATQNELGIEREIDAIKQRLDRIEAWTPEAAMRAADNPAVKQATPCLMLGGGADCFKQPANK